MSDYWLEYVHCHLPRLGLAPEREQEIAVELAQQLEQVEREAATRGANAAVARQRAEEHFPDWAALARAIVAAEAPLAARLPWRLRLALAAAAAGSELRLALRGLRRARGFAVVGVLTLALGIGACAAVFSLVNAVVLQPLPYRQPQQLMAMLETSRQFPVMSVSWPDYLDWQRDNRSFQQLAAFRGSDMVLTGHGPAAMVIGARVTANYFPMLGVAPERGRTFLPSEDRAGGPAVVVLSDKFWRSRLGGDPSWRGRTLDLDGEARTVVGVMPAGFPGGAALDSQAEFWTPLRAFVGEQPSLQNRGRHAGIVVLGRLRPGVSASAAQTDMARVSGALAAAYPATNADSRVRMQGYLDLLVGDSSGALWLLLAAVGLVLLIACANVANLLLARALSTQRERAVRAALGATRGRLWLQALAEGVCLGGLGGMAGLGLAELLLRLAPVLAPATLPRAGQLGLDARVVGFTVALAVLCSLLCALAPALRLGAVGIAACLKDGGDSPAPGGIRMRQALVAIEMALAVVLLAGAGLMVRSLARLQGIQPGFHAQGVLTFIIGLPDSQYPTRERQLAFFRRAEEKLHQLPGVAAVGGVFPLPLSGNDWEAPYTVVGAPPPAPGQEPSADIATVRGDYFAAMGIPLEAGRRLGMDDTGSAPPVAVVDIVFAQQAFGGATPASVIGRQVKLDGVNRTVVGVVAHVQDRSLAGAPRPELYLPQEQSKLNVAALSFVMQAAAGNPLLLAAPAEAGIAAVDAGQPVTDLFSMEQLRARGLSDRRRMLGLLGVLALLALVLAGVGIYGVMAFLVVQRTREIGVRMALGASRGRVLGLVMGQGLRLAAIGAAIGVLLATRLDRLLGAYLFGTAPSDPLTLAAVPALLLGIAAVGCGVPARRATRVDPLAALRAE
ncbi:MAG TPA: ABC transporter permease [Terriglobales bacterium]|nr:ABC transporter permease [Terriglobales bacterium]